MCSLQLSLTESELSKIGSIKVEAIINPTNAELDLKDAVGETHTVYSLFSDWTVLCLCDIYAPPTGSALEKAGGREFVDGVKELRKSNCPLEVAAGKGHAVQCFQQSSDQRLKFKTRKLGGSRRSE